MDKIINTVSIVIFILFGAYEIWMYKNRKSIKYKLLPIIITALLGVLILLLAPVMGVVGYYMVFIILIIELSFIGAGLVVLLELCLELFNRERNWKRILKLLVLIVLLIVIYYMGQRTF